LKNGKVIRRGPLTLAVSIQNIHAPFYIDETSGPSEVPLTGLASHSRGGTWLPKDCPINLHCFHYIARGALLKWWRDVVSEGEQSGQPVLM
jgi:hypothetical protein